MSGDERGMLAGCMTPEVFSGSEHIIKQGDTGHTMYIVAMGEAEATIDDIGPDGGPLTVKSYGSGDYFGELALIKNQRHIHPRMPLPVIPSQPGTPLPHGGRINTFDANPPSSQSEFSERVLRAAALVVIALLRRAANVVAVGSVTCLAIERAGFDTP